MDDLYDLIGDLRKYQKKGEHKKRINSHVIKRAIQRHDIRLNENHIKELEKLIVADKCEFVGRMSKNVKVFELKFRSNTLTACYDTFRKRIVTILPKWNNWTGPHSPKRYKPFKPFKTLGTFGQIYIHEMNLEKFNTIYFQGSLIYFRPIIYQFKN